MELLTETGEKIEEECFTLNPEVKFVFVINLKDFSLVC